MGLPPPISPISKIPAPAWWRAGSSAASRSRAFGWVRSNSLQGAAIDASADRYPLLILSPDNATNVELYGSLGEDLAGHGYVVVGLNHPFQVTAMSLDGGSVALYDASTDTGIDSAETKVAERVPECRSSVLATQTGRITPCLRRENEEITAWPGTPPPRRRLWSSE